jgi:hypothetical protein
LYPKEGYPYANETGNSSVLRREFSHGIINPMPMIAPVSFLGDTQSTDNSSWLAGWSNYSVAAELASDDVK